MNKQDRLAILDKNRHCLFLSTQILCPKGGVNDRFAVCRGADALTGYGDRLTSALSYCQRSCQPLHAERLLRFSLEEAGVRIGRLDVRSSRVRAGGRIETEDFRIRRWKTYRNYLRYRRDLRG
ncbi:MAG: hypothetical protein P8Q92_15360 [Pseudoprimorskyibacter sp.]|nr:hypothetical protein [Pseudoprimorskyibacter sp.]